MLYPSIEHQGFRRTEPAKTAAQTHGISYRTAGRWVNRYRRNGLAGLVQAQRRDKNQCKMNQTVNQLFLHKLPGYAPEREPIKKPKLTLVDFDAHFKDFLLNEYNLRVQMDMDSAPQVWWEADSFLPQMPESWEQLDLLL